MAEKNDSKKRLVVFQDKKIRRVWYGDEWWFSVVDIIDVLIDSEDARTYWKVLKHRLLNEGSGQTVTNCNPFKLLAKDGKYRFTDCTNTKKACKSKREEQPVRLRKEIIPKAQEKMTGTRNTRTWLNTLKSLATYRSHNFPDTVYKIIAPTATV